MISFTFDDFPRSALHVGGQILEEHGLSATYYAALGLINTEAPVGRIFSEEDLNEVQLRGHELGCHTFDHCHGWHTPSNAFEASVLRNREALNRLLPDASFQTHAYPYGLARPETKRRISEYFLCCRGGPQRCNFGRTDLNYLNAFFLEQVRGDLTAVTAVVDQNCRSGGWLIFGTHEVAENPSRLGCSPEFFRDVVRYAAASGATILPVAAALKSIIRPEV